MRAFEATSRRALRPWWIQHMLDNLTDALMQVSINNLFSSMKSLGEKESFHISDGPIFP